MGHEMVEPTTVTVLPTDVYVDNSGAVEISKRRESLARSRHIDRRYLKIQEWVAEGLIRVVYKQTDQNRADMFTKPLDREPFERHAMSIMGFSV